MSNDESVNYSTTLVHVENAADRIGAALEQFEKGEISVEDLTARMNEAVPKLKDVGCELGDDAASTVVNAQPQPENPDAAVYFHTDEDNTLKMTVRLFHYEDNDRLEADQVAEAGEMAALEVVRLVNLEHQSILEKAMLNIAMQQYQEQMGGGANGEGDDPLSAIEDEETREQVRKFTKH